MPDGDSPAEAAAHGGGPNPPPVVGRDYEIGVARQLLEAAAAGRGSALFLAGVPGVGKSRLAREIAREASGLGFAIRWGHCFENESLAPLRPWFSILRGLASDDTGLAPGILKNLEQLLTDVPGATSVEHLRLFDDVFALVAYAAERHPQLIVLEDVHWADTRTVLMLLHLVRRIGNAPALVVVTFRESELGDEHPVKRAYAELVERRAATELELRGLDQRDTGKLVATIDRALLLSLTPAELRRLWQQTDGIPFFVEELTRHLQSRQRSGGSGWGEPPRSIRWVLGERLKRLPDDTLGLLEELAFLGREFTRAEAGAMTGLSPDRLAEALRPAITSRFLDETTAGYRFVHALVGETLVESVPPARRPTLHLKAADAIVRVHGEAVGMRAGEMFRHLVGAAPLLDGERIFVAAEAAVQYALALGAIDEAAEALQMLKSAVVECGLDAPRCARLIVQTISPIATGLLYEVTRELGEFAIAHLDGLDNHLCALARLMVGFTYQSSARRELMNLHTGLRLAEEAMPGLLAAGDVENAGFARGMQANALFQLGRVAESLAITRSQEEASNPDTRAAHRALAGFYLMHLGQLRAGRTQLEEGWRETTSFIGRSTAYFFHHVTLLWRLRAPAASLVLTLLELSGRPGQPPNRDPGLVANRICARREMGFVPTPEDHDFLRQPPPTGDENLEEIEVVFFREGAWESTLAWYQQLYDRTRVCGGDQVIGMVGTVFAGFLRVAGRTAEAEAILGEGLRVTTPLDFVNAHAELGMLKAETGRYGEVTEHFAASRKTMAGDEDWMGLAARVDLLEAILEAVSGNLEAGSVLFDRATARMEELQFPWDVAEAHHQYGLALARNGHPVAAEAHFDESGRILERVVAGRPFFERLAFARTASEPGPRRASNGHAYGTLSAREFEVLRLISEGCSNRQIAERLVLSEATVATHVRHILQKTGTANRTEAAALALRDGLTNHQA